MEDGMLTVDGFLAVMAVARVRGRMFNDALWVLFIARFGPCGIADAIQWYHVMLDFWKA